MLVLYPYDDALVNQSGVHDGSLGNSRIQVFSTRNNDSISPAGNRPVAFCIELSAILRLQPFTRMESPRWLSQTQALAFYPYLPIIACQ